MGASTFIADSIRSKEELKPIIHVRDNYKYAEDQILDIIVSSGAVLKGHFVLESGQHSSNFFRFNNVVGDGSGFKLVTDCLVNQLRNDRITFDAVLMQESAGRSLGENIANSFNKRKIIIETDSRNRPTKSLINASSLYRGDRILLVSDLTTTGAGLRTMASVVRQAKGTPVAVVVFATRNKEAVSKFESEEHLKVYALMDLAFEHVTYGKPGTNVSNTDCSECRNGKPSIPSWEM